MTRIPRLAPHIEHHRHDPAAAFELVLPDCSKNSDALARVVRCRLARTRRLRNETSC